MIRLLPFLLIIFSLSSCTDSLGRLKRIGKAPTFEKIEIPETREDEEEVMRRIEKERDQHAYMRKTNSLWKPGSTKFFRDSRAWRVGDIIRVVVNIKDNATLNNSTNQKRSGSDSLGVPNLSGKEGVIQKSLSSSTTTANMDSLIKTTSNRSHTGSGGISRKEDVKTEIAAIVMKILPNGNLVVQGHQEVRINYELREIQVAGIIRPKDISSDNSIMTNQMAEARISYGGRGVVSDVQQPRPGAQIIDIISPF